MTFPSLIPSARVFTPGEYPNTAFTGWSGQENRTRHSNVMLSSALRVSFFSINETQLVQIIDHYNSCLGTYTTFALPSAVWSGVSDHTDYTLTGYSWRYAGPPLIEDLPCSIYNLELELQSVIPENATTSRRTWNVGIRWSIGTAIGLAAGSATAQGVEWIATIEWSEQNINASATGVDLEAIITWTPGAALEVVSNFDIALYTGNASTNTITGLNFEPGLVWIKSRSASGDHVYFDYARGATKYWRSSTLGLAEITSATTLTSFDANGFTLGSSTVVNSNTVTYAAWCWKKGGAMASNTDGTITSEVWADAASGFSIIKYTGTGTSSQTVGHGLGVKPAFIIVKVLTTSNIAPVVGGDALGANSRLALNATSAIVTTGDMFTSYTTSTFGLGGSNSNTNSNGDTFIAYAFTDLVGVRKFGTYAGGGATAATVTLGFEPRLVLIKSQSASTNWMWFDNDRAVTNQIIHTIAAESTVDKITFSSTGFTVKANENTNTSGQTFFYAAFR